MNIKDVLDVIDCELTQLSGTLFTLKRCVDFLREDFMTEDERMLKELRDEHDKEMDKE